MYDKWINKAKDLLDVNKSKNPVTNQDEKENVEGSHSNVFFKPDTDICGCEDGLVLEMDMPGIDKDKVKIEYENEILAIEGTIDLKDYEGLSPIYTEYRIGNYLRKFNIGAGYDIEKINASFNDGILTIDLPKREHLKPKKIEIK